MRICFLAPADSIHTEKWCNYFVSKGHEVHVVSFSNARIPGVMLHHISCGAESGSSDIKKLLYLFKSVEVGKIVRKIKPDIINAHYATSYGTVAALAGLKNYIVSVWGSDIYAFPGKSPFHRAMLSFSLNRAPHLFSTSVAMADEASKYTHKKIEITPFGVNCDLFSPQRNQKRKEFFTIGTVKSLAPNYGIDHLIRAAGLLKKEHPEIPLRIRIAGDGPQKDFLMSLAEDCGVEDVTTWLGYISQERASEEWAGMDVAVIPSEAESFGVAAVEAQASGTPVIISDIPGLMEATSPGKTSLVVSRGDERTLADTIIDLYQDEKKRLEMGKNARAFVLDTYEYQKCFQRIEKLFESICI